VNEPLRVRVLICGQRLRGDDGAALLAAEMLPADVQALAEIASIGQLAVEALLEVPDGTAVVVADAAVGVPAGELVTLPLDTVADGGPGPAPASSHALPPVQVLALAREVRGRLPPGSFVGIGGTKFDPGEGLSPQVSAGLPAFVAALAAEIRRLAAALA
jgi:hydrogenase maturation protease